MHKRPNGYKDCLLEVELDYRQQLLNWVVDLFTFFRRRALIGSLFVYFLWRRALIGSLFVYFSFDWSKLRFYYSRLQMIPMGTFNCPYSINWAPMQW
jgi:hypothetical protein